MTWAMMNAQQDEREIVERESRLYKALYNIVHGNPEKTGALLFGQREVSIDPDFEAEMNSDLWWGEADESKGINWND